MASSRLVLSGDGDTIINGVISGDIDPSSPVPTLGNLNQFPTDDYSFTADGQTFTGHVDNDGTNSWLLVGRGRNGWEFDADGPGGNVADVITGLGTAAAFVPTAYSDVMIN